MMRAAVLVLFTSVLLVSQTNATVGPFVGPNKAMVATELVLGAAGLALGVENATQARHGDQSLVRGLVGLGIGAGSLALSITRAAELPGFDVVAGSIAVLGSTLRLRIVRGNVSELSQGSSLLVVSLRF